MPEVTRAPPIRLRRSDCAGPGIRRERRGRGFSYRDGEGRRIEDPEVLARIAELAIPPAWAEVWICPYPGGHIQATGVDAAGRKQYLYHQRWRQRRDQQKFDEMLEFARALPALRDQVDQDLHRGDLGREHVLGCAVRLLDRGAFRVGSEDYAQRNETYGLATLCKRHVRVRKEIICFDYPAKGGKRQVQSFLDPEVREVIVRLKGRRGGGSELLAYRVGRRWVDLRSADINEYLKLVTGQDFSAKDFRTWNATVLAALALAVSGQASASRTARKRAMSRAVAEVSRYLGNTPAIARASYIDPRVFDRFESGLTIGGVLGAVGDDPTEIAIHGPVEEAVLELIAGHEASPAIERVA
ncbi:MAG TPA: DNA topoisomerase IB [Solirubrobacteraceae bacterium]|nr:DNA topoisomerase IB [Solirubrobacteraceae bacterium]